MRYDIKMACGPKCNAEKCAGKCIHWQQTSNEIIVKVEAPIIPLPACAGSPNCSGKCAALALMTANFELSNQAPITTPAIV
jgi:hypothetical protein